MFDAGGRVRPLQMHSSLGSISDGSVACRAGRRRRTSHTAAYRRTPVVKAEYATLPAQPQTVLRPVSRSVRAFAPATVANLGPGFDWMGCAVEVTAAHTKDAKPVASKSANSTWQIFGRAKVTSSQQKLCLICLLERWSYAAFQEMMEGCLS